VTANINSARDTSTIFQIRPESRPPARAMTHPLQ
jgi:hypothetical protein